MNFTKVFFIFRITTNNVIIFPSDKKFGGRIMTQVFKVNEAYTYLKNNFGYEFLESDLGLERRTIQNYERGKFPKKKLNHQAKSIIIAFRVSCALAEFPDIEIKREFRAEVRPGETMKDLIMRFSESPDLLLAIESIEYLIEKRLEDLKQSSPLEKFRSKYGNYNEKNLLAACKNNDFELLKQIVLSANLDARPKGYALMAIAENDERQEYKDFIEDFFFNDSPYLREASVMASHQYLDDESEEEVEKFKEKLLEIYKSSKMFPGVLKTVNDIIGVL